MITSILQSYLFSFGLAGSLLYGDLMGRQVVGPSRVVDCDSRVDWLAHNFGALHKLAYRSGIWLSLDWREFLLWVGWPRDGGGYRMVRTASEMVGVDESVQGHGVEFASWIKH